ncbi:MAG: hypothetical protein IH855_03625 [Bacteroidetes bacterium]|nr:hypothetical protein [Bacteroidota bacterium]
MKLSVKPTLYLQVDQPQIEPDVSEAAQQAVAPPTTDARGSEAVVQGQVRPLQADLNVDLAGTGADLKPGREQVEKHTPGTSPVAIFVTHGMGQQLKFATLDMVANGIERALERRTAGAMEIVDVYARTVHLGDVRTERLEMCIRRESDGLRLAVHIYEGYWAPLTEGKVTLRDVMAFLYRAAWNGLKKGIGQPLERYMFGRQTLHRVTGGSFVGLLVTALVLGSLVLLNTVIAGVGLNGGYDVLVGVVLEGEYAARGIVPDTLTRIIFWYLMATVLFGVLLGMMTSYAKKEYDREPSSAWRFVTAMAWWAGFWPWVLLTLAAGVLTLAVLLRTVLPSGMALGLWLVYMILGLVVVMIVAGWYSVREGKRAFVGYNTLIEEQRDDAEEILLLSNGKTMAVAVLMLMAAVALIGLVILVLAVLDVTGFLAPTGNSLMRQGWFQAVVWSSLFLVSALIRNVIVQYLGDVAAYVSPHTLDRFAELRNAIKTACNEILNGVYHHVKDGRYVYEDVAVVGHSLGSVVAYDALNRALNDDERINEKIGVRERTKLLLTFGSPLDKTAYIFRGQNRSLSLVREALANAVQPMIRDYRIRSFPWINVHSKRDIIGSALDLYDRPTWKKDQNKYVKESGAGRTYERADARVKDLMNDLAQKAKAAEKEERDLRKRMNPELQKLDADTETSPFLYCVHDIEDKQALIPLVAHNEHWHTSAVFDVLVEVMIAQVLEKSDAMLRASS